MLPPSYELPVAILLVLSGALACFAGYRLFRLVMAVYGFVLGAMLASSVMGPSSTTGMAVAALVGGVIGAVVLVFAYFVGIALVGAGLGALAAHAGWGYARSAEPPALGVILLAVLGAALAMVLQRYVIIVMTAFGGAWTLIVGVIALEGIRRATRPLVEAWVLYPMSPAPGRRWVYVGWIGLGLVGVFVQFTKTSRRR